MSTSRLTIAPAELTALDRETLATFGKLAAHCSTAELCQAKDAQMGQPARAIHDLLVSIHGAENCPTWDEIMAAAITADDL